jgi:hypothetical protein
MSDEHVAADVQDLWQGQPATGEPITLAQIRSRSRRLQRMIVWRNLPEYIAAALLVPTFGWLAWITPSALMRLGAGLWVAAVIFIVYHLSRHGAARAMPADMALASCLEFHRGELVRQRDLLRGWWKWYLLPCIPGLFVVQVGSVLAHPERASRLGWGAVGTVILAVLIAALNYYGANRIQSRIDALERNT